MPNPILSICIPTYNRAELLSGLLSSIVPQVEELKDKVEIVVCDNCSTDHTEAIVRRWSEVRYHKNEENLGAGLNFLTVTNNLAQGEFCWIVGDDDLVIQGAVKNIVDELCSHPEIDYAFVNSFYENSSKRGEFSLLTDDNYSPAQETLMCSRTDTFIVRRWEDIEKFALHAALFTSIINHVFRLSVWKKIHLELSPKDHFQSLEATFPHTCIIARSMVGKRALYIGKPGIVLLVGSQEWIGYWPMIQVVRTLELSDLMESLGARKRMIHRYRNTLFKNSSEHFWRLATNPNQPGREFFSISSLVLRYWRYRAFWRMLIAVPRAKCIRKLGQLKQYINAH